MLPAGSRIGATRATREQRAKVVLHLDVGTLQIMALALA